MVVKLLELVHWLKDRSPPPEAAEACSFTELPVAADVEFEAVPVSVDVVIVPVPVHRLLVL